jgi:antitoxin ParD1/3/4
MSDDHLAKPLTVLQKREILASLDAAIARGLADAAADRSKPAEEVSDRLEAQYRRMAG